mmetsp:Transcript_122360/g.391461  ORF Transcript_122360/g.391461 Transcript_122360/m.391461 type:complete len:311 (+) Transcript_122360:798-1730(+)
MTASQVNFCPDFREAVRPLPSVWVISVTEDDPINVTPFSSKKFLIASPTRMPNTRSNGTVSMPSTVTSQPRRFKVAAISMPMKDEPITMTFLPLPQAAPMRCASSGVRRAITPGRLPPGIGSRRGFAPVATKAASYLISSPETSWTIFSSARSSFTAAPNLISISCSWKCASSRSANDLGSAPLAKFFDSTGRSYGRCVSSVSIVTWPVKPPCLKASTAATPAAPPPMTKNTRPSLGHRFATLGLTKSSMLKGSSATMLPPSTHTGYTGMAGSPDPRTGCPVLRSKAALCQGQTTCILSLAATPCASGAL